MTDLSLSPTTHTAPLVEYSNSNTATLLATATPNRDPLGEEEDYTIKCICDFQEDDGKTILCELCETWQHIDCYYYLKKVPEEDEEHHCADCEPRALDAKRATERQKKRREQLDLGDRKAKKPAGKSHKKKVKPIDQQIPHTNGWLHESTEVSSPRNGTSTILRDQPPPTKRPKISHRASASVHAAIPSPSGTAHVSKRSTSASHVLESPSKISSNRTSEKTHRERYSSAFLHLYEDDPGDEPLKQNLFVSIKAVDSLSEWSHDVDALTQATNGKSHQDIFLRCEQPLDTLPLPQLEKQTKIEQTVEIDGLHPRWTFLTIDRPVLQNSIVGELKGKVGFMSDYVQDPDNSWEYLRHPLPFVFFHPHLPIYIDTRKEGNNCRYLRRSCRPNLKMKTILENSYYHFCFIADQDLEAGTELTIGWTLDEHVRTYLLPKSEAIEQESMAVTHESYVTDWVGKVLAHFGGCACDGQADCSMAKFDSLSRGYNVDAYTGKARKRNRDVPTMSSTGTGRITNSRSGSEALKHHDEDEHDDSRSTTNSSRSKSNSRDRTPNHNLGDSNSAAGEELSAREQRKIAAQLNHIEHMGQEKHHSVPKKKKRNSGGSTLSTTAASIPHSRPITGRSPHLVDKGDQRLSAHHSTTASVPHTPDASSRPRYIDTSTAHGSSDSPTTKPPQLRTSYSNSPSIPSPLARCSYVDSSMQTDPDSDDEPRRNLPMPRKPCSTAGWLLRRCRKERLVLEEAKRAALATSTPRNGAPDIPSGLSPSDTVKELKDSDGDIVMQNKDDSPLLRERSSNTPVEKPRPPDPVEELLTETPQSPEFAPKAPPLSQNSPISQPPRLRQLANGSKTDLSVETVKRPFLADLPTPALVGTPTTIASSIAQSPLIGTSTSYPFPHSHPPQPSPIKTRLTFDDYLKRKSHHKAETSASNPVVADGASSGSSPTLMHTKLKSSAGVDDESKG